MIEGTSNKSSPTTSLLHVYRLGVREMAFLAMNENRQGLTFRQAEGADPLPSQMALRTVTPELRARLWAVVHASFEDASSINRTTSSMYLNDPWRSWLKEWWVNRIFKNIDEMPGYYKMRDLVKSYITNSDYLDIFQFIQFIIERDTLGRLRSGIESVLIQTKCAYRVIDKMIVPISSDEQAFAIKQALSIAAAAGAAGPIAHLRAATAALSRGDWAGSIQQSIHAVEGAAKSVEPSADTLGPALTKLQDSIGLPPALRKAFNSLYGWTSDAEGLRHALVFEGQANVGERDAMFMFGACGAFVGYLLSAQVDGKRATV